MHKIKLCRTVVMPKVIIMVIMISGLICSLILMRVAVENIQEVIQNNETDLIWGNMCSATELLIGGFLCLKTGMGTRPFRPRLRWDPRRIGPRPRWDRDIGHFVRDETETFQLPRSWSRRMVKTIISTTKSTELVSTLYLWRCGILPLVHYVHCAVLLQ